MIDLPLEEIRDAFEAAFAKIGQDPNRINELDDEGLLSVATYVKTARPLMERTLLAYCNGDLDKANTALEHVAAFSKGKLVKLVRAGQLAMKTHRNPSLNQLAAFVYDLQAGVGAVMVEQERRQASRAGRMN